jgi:hypothetical protein
VSFDPSTPAGKVRLIISDLDRENLMFSGDEIDAFLSLEDGSVKRAAAQALDAIASNEALVQKKIKLLDLQTDGPAVAKALREHATALRAQDDTEGDDGGFDVVEMITSPSAWREQVL